MLFARKPSAALTYLSEKSEFQGDLHVEGSLRVDGIVHGTVDVQGDLEISRTGLVEGPEIHANNLIVHGVVKGRIVVNGRLTLSRTARLEGDVSAQSIDIEPGAFYIGHITTSEAKGLPGAGKLPELIGRESQ